MGLLTLGLLTERITAHWILIDTADEAEVRCL